MLAASYGMFDQAGADQSKTHKPRTHAHSSKTPRAKTKRGLPENYNYSDTGCELAPSCLECPLATCKYDDPNWNRRNRMTMRDTEIMRLFANGIKISAIAREVNISDRTVYRVVQREIGIAVKQPGGVPKRAVPRRSLHGRVPIEQLDVWRRE